MTALEDIERKLVALESEQTDRIESRNSLEARLKELRAEIDELKNQRLKLLRNQLSRPESR